MLLWKLLMTSSVTCHEFLYASVGVDSLGDGTGANEVADPLEDEDVQHMWRWELRDVKVLPKAQRQGAQALKKSLLKVMSQQCCTSAVCVWYHCQVVKGVVKHPLELNCKMSRVMRCAPLSVAYKAALTYVTPVRSELNIHKSLSRHYGMLSHNQDGVCRIDTTCCQTTKHAI